MAEDVSKPADIVSIDIASAEQLFSTDAIDPFSDWFDVVSGIARIVEAAGARPDLGAGIAGLTIRLPASGIDAGCETRIREAIGRYCHAQADDIGRRIDVIRRQGYQTLGLGLVFAAVCVIVSLVLDSILPEQSLLGRLLQSGVVIAGWVALWRPVDLLLYEPWLLRREARVFEAIARAPVTVSARD